MSLLLILIKPQLFDSFVRAIKKINNSLIIALFFLDENLETAKNNLITALAWRHFKIAR